MNIKLNEELFKTEFAILRENFNFEVSTPYLSLIFQSLENKISDEAFKTATKRYILEVTMEIWNKKYGFNGKPALADWLEFFTGNRILTLDQQAEIQVERIIEAASYPISILFDNGHTNATIIAYGGLKKINYDHFDSYNPNPKTRHWLKTELIKIWLTCQAENKNRFAPFYIGGNTTEIKFVGDKSICQKMLYKAKKLEVTTPKAIEDLAKAFKSNTSGKFDFEKAREMAIACTRSPYN